MTDHHVSTFNAAVNPVYLSFSTGEPVLLGRSFRSTLNWHAWRDSNPHLTGSKPAALSPLSYKRMAESRVVETQPLRVTWLSKPARSLTDLLSNNLEEGGGVEPLSISQYPGVQALFVAKDGTFHLVGVVRFELTTSRLKAGCSSQLSYTPINLELRQRIELCYTAYKTDASPAMLTQLGRP